MRIPQAVVRISQIHGGDARRANAAARLAPYPRCAGCVGHPYATPMTGAERDAIAADHPGADLVRAGLNDLTAGRMTVPALLLASASDRLGQAGIVLPGPAVPDAAERMYDPLAVEQGDGAHGRYNALRRRLIAFCQSVEADARARRQCDAESAPSCCEGPPGLSHAGT